MSRVLAGDHSGKGLTTCKVVGSTKEVGLLINFRYRLEAEGLRFKAGSSTPGPQMEALLEEIVPVFVSEAICSRDRGHLYGKVGYKCPKDLNALLGDYLPRIGEWVRKAERELREHIARKKAEFASDRAERIRIREEDLNRFFDGKKEILQKRLSQYEREQEWGTDRRLLIANVTRELERLQERFERERTILRNTRTVFDSVPEILNVAWIVPAKLVSGGMTRSRGK
jgi:hypothetical protein